MRILLPFVSGMYLEKRAIRERERERVLERERERQ